MHSQAPEDVKHIMLKRRILIAALTALLLSLGAIAVADEILLCPNVNCPNRLECPGALTGVCPFAGPQGQGQGKMGPPEQRPEDCPEECPNDGEPPRDGTGIKYRGGR